jgi:tyrosyl-tRNA synthetase
MKTASGTKFGKTEAGTVWLDAARTSPFRFYQFWLNVEDRDVVAYLKSFTFLDRREIEALEAATGEFPERREAQRQLAREVTTAGPRRRADGTGRASVEPVVRGTNRGACG